MKQYYSTAKAKAIIFTDDTGNEKTFYQLTNDTSLPVNFLGEQTETLSHNVFGIKASNEPQVSIYLSEEQFNKMQNKTYHCIISLTESGAPQITQVSEKQSEIPKALLAHTSFYNPLTIS